MLAVITSVVLSLAPEPLADPFEAEGEAQPTEAQPTEALTPEPEPQPEPEPSPVPVPEPSAPSGGFGQVGEVRVDSDVRALPPSEPRPGEDDEAETPGVELSGRAEIGFAQTHVGNAGGLDHTGLFLRAHLALLPWVSRSRAIAAGIGAAYTYVGLNRPLDPELGFGLARSSAQQQAITLNFEVLARPHVDWFAIHLSPMIGLGWYANAELLMGDRPAEIASDEYGFAAGGSLALCTAWAIACVTGGSQIVLGIRSTALETDELEARVLSPWGWHVALGVDIARIVMRVNRVPR